MYRVTIEASSIDELRVQVTQLANAVGAERAVFTPATSAPVETSAPAPATETASEKRPVGRPRKAPAETEANVKTPAPAPEPTPEKVEKKWYKLDDVRTALQAAAIKAGGGDAGIQRAREIIGQFTSERGTAVLKISELKNSDYEAVVAACAA